LHIFTVYSNHHHITEIFLKVALNTIPPPPFLQQFDGIIFEGVIALFDI
jgi:hypothetical protein